MQDDDDYISKTLAGEWASLRSRIAELESQLSAGDTVSKSKEGRRQGAPADDALTMDGDEPRQQGAPSRESQEMFSRVFAMLPEAVLLVECDSERILEANAAAAFLFGFDRRELVGMPYARILAGQDERPVAAMTGMLPVNMRKKNGDLFPAEIAGSRFALQGRDVFAAVIRIRSAAGDIEQMVAVGLDATESNPPTAEPESCAGEDARVRELEEANAEMRALLKEREQDRKALVDNIVISIEELIIPSIQRLDGTRLDEVQRTYVDMLKSALRQMSAPFRNKLVQKQGLLSPMEMQVANLIKAGKGNKEIAEILGVSLNTVMTHRYHLRTKLGVKGEKVNLRTFLNSANGSCDKSSSSKDH